MHALPVPIAHFLQSRSHLSPLSLQSGARRQSTRYDAFGEIPDSANELPSRSKRYDAFGEVPDSAKGLSNRSKRHDAFGEVPDSAKELPSRSQRHDAFGEAPDSANELPRRRDAWQESAVALNQRRRRKRALTQPPQRDLTPVTPNLAKLGRRDPSMSEKDWNRRRLELRYLQDPMDLAVFVAKELRKDKIKEMLQLVVMASQSMDCIVSWNHIIKYYLDQGRIANALKVYNDVPSSREHVW